MQRKRVFLPTQNLSKRSFIINDKEKLHHLIEVTRIKSGDCIYLLDGRGIQYEGIIEEIVDKKFIKGKVVSTSRYSENKIMIKLFQTIIKSRNMDLVIKKAAELGVRHIIPIITQNSVVIIKEEKEKQRRWQKLAEEGARINSYYKPKIDNIATFKEALLKLEDKDSSVTILLTPVGNISIKDILRDNKDNIKSINLFVGPEGDFTDKELEEAQRRNVNLVSLGDRIFTSEMASIMGIIIILYELNSLCK